VTVKQGPSDVSVWWRLLALVAASTAGVAVAFSGEFGSLVELFVRLVGATFVAVTVYTVTMNAGAD